MRAVAKPLATPMYVCARCELEQPGRVERRPRSTRTTFHFPDGWKLITPTQSHTPKQLCGACVSSFESWWERYSPNQDTVPG